jgi:hypothetical protein
MLGQLMRTTFREWKKQKVVFDSSFQVVCLFSFLGIVLSLLFLDIIAPPLGVGLTLTQLP